MLKKMTDCIAYRGPDGEGSYVKDNLALGHRRLSIIDPAAGHQPMFNADGTKACVFNGEIYNYIELREELKQLGHTFATDSDTEVLLHSYEQWGYGCQLKFNGMWAFAIWDAEKQELFLSRDRFGEKPLHYCTHHHTFVFASELKSIFEFGLPKETRLELTEVYLALTTIPAPDTFYKNIYKLMPGHYLVVKNGEATEKAYWEFPQISEADMLTDKEAIYNKFEALLTDAVKIRMRSDVPFGAFLSGGLDSSSVLSLMAKQSAHPIKTFTIGFAAAGFDESKLAEEVATAFKTEHHHQQLEPTDAGALIGHISFHCDEPFGDSSAIATDMVSRYAATKVKMVLTGDGGDECLGGYTAYKAIKVSAMVNAYLPPFVKHALLVSLRAAQGAVKGGARHRLTKIRRALSSSLLPFSSRMAETTAFTDLYNIKRLCAGIPGLIPVESYFESLLARCRFRDDFYKLMYVHYHHHLPNDYLVKVDRMGMANSIETRMPFLDYRLVEFMAGVHKDVKLQGWELKSILRKTIGKQLPPAILSAPKKGFAVPLREWFRDKELGALLEGHLEYAGKLLDRVTIRKIVAENASGKKDNGNFIWALMQLNQALGQRTNNKNSEYITVNRPQ